MTSDTEHQTARRPDSAARTAGIFLIATAAATALAVIGRVSADADQPTLIESLTAISANSELYALGGIARFVSGITLIAAAWFLLRTWIIRERFGTPLVPALFALSALFTAASGACAVWLAMTVPSEVQAIFPYARFSIAEPVYDMRWITGKIGFTAAGLALIVAARYQWNVGGTLRRIAPLSALIGVAMQFIWIDAATIMHSVIGTAFFLWLIAVGGMLSTGRVERHFTAMLASRPQPSPTKQTQ